MYARRRRVAIVPFRVADGCCERRLIPCLGHAHGTPYTPDYPPSMRRECREVRQTVRSTFGPTWHDSSVTAVPPKQTARLPNSDFDRSSLPIQDGVLAILK